MTLVKLKIKLLAQILKKKNSYMVFIGDTDTKTRTPPNLCTPTLKRKFQKRKSKRDILGIYGPKEELK